MAAAFIVDGVLEKRVVQSLCRNAPVRMTNMNGRSVAIAALARAISSLIGVFSDRHYPIVIIIDREQRQSPSVDVELELQMLLEQEGHNADDLIIACPDRMIENWICAGSDNHEGNAICRKPDYDGCHGKLEIKTELRTYGVTYRETTVGVDMFVRMKHQLAVQRSVSYHRFAEKMIGFCPKLRAALS